MLRTFVFLIDDRMIRTYAGAGAALHTGIDIDFIEPVKLFNRSGRTNFPAGPANHAIFCNKISHDFLLFTSRQRRMKCYQNFQQ